MRDGERESLVEVFQEEVVPNEHRVAARVALRSDGDVVGGLVEDIVSGGVAGKVVGCGGVRV